MLSGRTAVIPGGAHGIGLAATTGRKSPDRRTHRRVATYCARSVCPSDIGSTRQLFSEVTTLGLMGGPSLRVAIIGAGIGGLSLGLALRERGLRADVFEQASELAEIGAAIALSANALREYARLGLVDELAAASTVPTELIYRHWRDGHRIAAHPVRENNAYVERFGAPYFGERASGLPARQPGRAVRLGGAGVRQRPHRARRRRRWRRRGALHSPPVGHRSR